MGLGLQTGAGAAAFTDTLHKLIAEQEEKRLLAQAVAAKAAQQQIENTNEDRRISAQEADLKQRAAERQAADLERRQASESLAVRGGIDDAQPGQDLTYFASTVSKNNPNAQQSLSALRMSKVPNVISPNPSDTFRLPGTTEYHKPDDVRSPSQSRTQFRDIPAPKGQSGKWQQLYDLNTGSAIGAPTPAYEAPRQAGQITPNQEASLIQRMSGEWDKAITPIAEMNRQAQIMDVGMAQARAGDTLSGSQAVIQTFNKILDPLSVVRESEYARSQEGLALLSRVKGQLDKLIKGGAGIPLAELEQFARFADDAINELSSGYIQEVKSRTQRKAKHFDMDENLVLTEVPTRKRSSKTVTMEDLQRIALNNKTTVEQEKARATAAGYVIK